MESPALSLHQINKKFYQNNNELWILKQIDFVLEKGEMVALTGASGAGKTTLLQIMGLIDDPTSGSIDIGTYHCDVQSDKAKPNLKLRDLTRKNYLGFVYQYHYLLPELTAIENVILPQLIVGKPKDIAWRQASRLLDEMGLASRLNHTLHQLSGGEQQRVAVARALANEPQIVLADEPTGNLDDITASQIFNMMLTLVQERNISMVIATHNMELANRMNRIIHLHQGKLE